MTPLPKRCWSTQRQGKKRATQKIKDPQITYCQECHQPVLPHTVCPNCGFYKGRQVLKLKQKKKEK